MASLANKTALVTGASRGIGRATAEALAKMGANPGTSARTFTTPRKTTWGRAATSGR